MPKTSGRLLALLSLLQARRDWPGALLASRLEVSERTVRRDVDRLRELGYPIAAVKGPDGGYRLDAGSQLPPLLFDDDQAVALAVALRTASGAGIEEAAARALNTVRQVMPARLRHRVDALRVTAADRAGPRVDPSVLAALSAAVHAREVLRFDYVSGGPVRGEVPRTDSVAAGVAVPGSNSAAGGVPRVGEVPRSDSLPAGVPQAGEVLRSNSAAGGVPRASEVPRSDSGTAGPPHREVPHVDPVAADSPSRGEPRVGPVPAGPPRRVEPHHVVTWGGRWYLVAWDLDRADWRTFRADRITPRVPAGPRFAPRELPGGDVAAFVASRFTGKDLSGDWPCRGEVLLDLPAHVVSEYARDGVVEELGPDRCRLVLGAWSWIGLAATIGRFDADIEVVEPPELREAFARLARRYTAAADRPLSL
ncbi:WYL domain-containing protein [Amycolatopsis sp. FBCC-B4732]|uniref:helix-turn-helix transcriptional regulator n=1 Tax=Amycolatopsis sp. FBCC-B4732 TaxID=3079339 RepID=UPI001FF699C6|nr:WYL domain-containing protein [Amycolatopsis sp. FBCC-B4732]UOX93104.1 WYL domain-containing protein [Amycolatopsis sp. FBCC-B4732]